MIKFGKKSDMQKGLDSRVDEYKKFWHNDETIKYKDDYHALIRSQTSGKVEFFIAFSDLTKEGYKCVASSTDKYGHDTLYFQRMSN